MTNCMKVESTEWKYSLCRQFCIEVSAYIGRFVFNGRAHTKYAIIRGIGVRCDLSELIETGFGNVHPPPKINCTTAKLSNFTTPPTQNKFASRVSLPVCEFDSFEKEKILLLSHYPFAQEPGVFGFCAKVGQSENRNPKLKIPFSNSLLFTFTSNLHTFT